MNGQGYFPNNYYNPQRPMYPTYFPQTQESPYLYQQPQMENQNFPGGINGKIISGPEEITPRDVAMDGGMCIFPKNDFSVIYAKQWTPDGKIRTVEFIPKVADVQESPNQTEAITSYFDKRFDELEKAICEIKSQSSTEQPKAQTEKPSTRRS